MARVKIKYLGTVRELTKVRNEEIEAKNLGELMDKIGNRYKKLRDYLNLYEKETTDLFLIILYNHSVVRNIKDYERELKDGDEVSFMSVIAGG